MPLSPSLCHLDRERKTPSRNEQNVKMRRTLKLRQTFLRVRPQNIEITPINAKLSIKIPMRRLQLSGDLENFYANLLQSQKGPTKQGSLSRWLLSSRGSTTHIFEVQKDKRISGIGGLVFKLVQYQEQGATYLQTKAYFSKNEMDELRAFLKSL